MRATGPDRIGSDVSHCPWYRFGENMRLAGFDSCFLQGFVYIILATIALCNFVAFAVTKKHCFLYLGVAFVLSLGTFLGFNRIKMRNMFNIKLEGLVSGYSQTKQIQLFIFYIYLLHQLLSFYHHISWYQEPKFPIKMPPKRNNNIYDVYERIMARMEERLDQFVDQFTNQMNDMMNPRRRGDRNGRRSEGKESENPFFEGDDSSL
nr:cell number regulator 2 [Tanacetum cinerariifolium]